MKIRYLVAVPAAFLFMACGGSSTPEPETPAGAASDDKTEAATPKQKAEEASETPEQEKTEEKGEKGTEGATDKK
jgi:hypothetical protein